MGDPIDRPEAPTPRGSAARREVERALVGVVLRFPSSYYEVARVVTEEDLWEVSHRHIFAAVAALRARGAPADVPAVFDELAASGRLQEAGGAAYIQEVYEAGSTPSSAEYYAKKVREQATLDRLQRVLAEHLHHADRRQGDAQSILAAAEAAVFEVSRAAAGAQDGDLIARVVDRVYDLIDLRAKGELQGIPTGLTDLDHVLTGLHAGQLIVVGSRPSVGKTALACNLIKSACHNGHLTLLFSLEMSAEEIGERLLVLESGIHSQDVRTGALNQADVARLRRAGDRVRQWPLRINDTPSMRVSAIASAARRESANGLGLVIVDYLQLLDAENRKASRQEQVAAMSRGLKLLARGLGVPVVALSQLNRESESRANQRPKMSDLRDSGAVEQDADVVVLLHRTPENPGRLELLVEKQRNGPRGDVPVKYEPEYFRLSDL